MSKLNRTLPLVLVLLFALANTGCFRYGVASDVPSDGVERVQKGPVLFWGLAGKEHLVPDCPNGVQRASSYMPWWGGLIGLITIGIAAPWRVEYVCAAPSGAVPPPPAAAPAPEPVMGE